MPNETEVFNNAVADAIKGVYDQECASVSSSGIDCMYRGPNNEKCAVGYIIANEYYSESLELEDLSNPGVINAVSNSLGFKLTSAQLGTLGDLQHSHDCCNHSVGESFQKEFIENVSNSLQDKPEITEFVLDKYPELKEYWSV